MFEPTFKSLGDPAPPLLYNTVISLRICYFIKKLLRSSPQEHRAICIQLPTLAAPITNQHLRFKTMKPVQCCHLFLFYFSLTHRKELWNKKSKAKLENILDHVLLPLCVQRWSTQTTKVAIRVISNHTWALHCLSACILLWPPPPRAITEEMKVTDEEYKEMLETDWWLSTELPQGTDTHHNIWTTFSCI